MRCSGPGHGLPRDHDNDDGSPVLEHSGVVWHGPPGGVVQAMMFKPPKHAVTIKDIASKLKMSHSTVSRALNDHWKISKETKQRVREAADQLGYVANLSARLIRGDAGLQVGLLIPDIQNDFYSSIST